MPDDDIILQVSVRRIKDPPYIKFCIDANSNSKREQALAWQFISIKSSLAENYFAKYLDREELR